MATKTTRKNTTRKQSTVKAKVVAVAIPEVKDFWLESKCRTNAREDFGTAPSCTPALAELVIVAMAAKRDIRRHKEGAKKGFVYGSQRDAEKALDEALDSLGMKLGAAKQFARATVWKGQRLFDHRLAAEIE